MIEFESSAKELEPESGVAHVAHCGYRACSSWTRVRTGCAAGPGDTTSASAGITEAAERQASAGVHDGVEGQRNDLAERAPPHALVCRGLNGYLPVIDDPS